ncbi:transcription factor mef2A-like isoform X2 [Wyeomyia smithii]|nr:transcription factor mef2A-like isoform X2 [Wyeomyia smithii]
MVELSERKQQLSNNWHHVIQATETAQDHKYKGMVRPNNNHQEPAPIRHIPAFSYLNPNGHQILRYSPNNVDQQSSPQYYPNNGQAGDGSGHRYHDMPSHYLQNHQQQQQEQTPPNGQGKGKKQSSKNEYKMKEKENKERKKKEKKAKKEKDKSSSSTSGASSGVSSSVEKARKEPKKKPPMPYPQPQMQQQQQQQQQSPSSKRMVEQHDYQNISEETKIDSNSPVMRMFGDTNFLLNHRRKNDVKTPKESNLSCGQGVCELMNGVYRFSPHVTSFAELESGKVSHRSHPSTLDSKEYHNFNVSKYLNIDVKTPNLRSVKNHISSNSSCLSTGSSGSNSLNSFDSVEQAIIFQKNKNADSYLGPFNFRQLLRPTQGPTESLRKRKGINPPSPPPPQRGKS